MARIQLTTRSFVNFQRMNKLIKKGDRLLLAVSGGMDSMVMVDLFLRTMRELSVSCGIAHVNHGLRRSSDRDERFVRRFARQKQLPFFFARVDVNGLARGNKRSIEDAARELRYAFLQEAAAAGDFTTICTAHHLNDQAETVLMRILKGTGIDGLAGIRLKNGQVIRPLLCFDRLQIEAYARSRCLEHVEDPTNRSPDFLRNRLRNQVLPTIRNIVDPQAEQHLADLAALFQSLQSAIQRQSERALKSITRQSGSKILLDIKGFNRYLAPHKFYMVQRILRLSAPLAKNTQLDSSSYNLISRLLSSQTGKKSVIGSVRCIKNRGHLVFENVASAPPSRIEKQWSVTSVTNSTGIRANLGKSKTVEYIDGDKVKGRLELRYWRTGDRFRPLGMQGSKLLSNFFIDCKVPVFQKTSIPVIVDRGKTFEHIVWVCGYRLDHRYRLTPSTTKVLKLECAHDCTSDQN